MIKKGRKQLFWNIEKKRFYGEAKGECLKKWWGCPNLEWWIAKRPSSFLHAHLVTIKKITELIRGRFPYVFPNTGGMSVANRWGWRGRAQQHLGYRGKKLLKRKQQLLSRPLAPAGEVAPQAPLLRGRPPPHLAPFRTHGYAALDPLKCPRSRTTPPLSPTHRPIPTKFHEKLPPRARPVLDNRWAVAPAGLGLPSQAHSTPPRPGPGGARLRDGRGSSLPYLRHICRTDGSHLRGGRSWVTARTRMWDSATGLQPPPPLPLPPPLPRRERAGDARARPPHPTPPPRGAGAQRDWREKARTRARARPRGSPPPEERGGGGAKVGVEREVGISAQRISDPSPGAGSRD